MRKYNIRTKNQSKHNTKENHAKTIIIIIIIIIIIYETNQQYNGQM